MELRDRLQQQVTEDAKERAEMAKAIGGIVEEATMRALGAFFRR